MMRARVKEVPALEVAAAIFESIAVSLEDAGPRRDHDIALTFAGASSTKFDGSP
jgi:hypothetical protein